MTDNGLGADFALCNATQVPRNWPEVVAQVEHLDAAWEALDLEDEAESARVCDMHEKTMLALLRAPAPDAAGLIYKVRTLHAAGRIQCDDEVLARICSDIAALYLEPISPNGCGAT